MTGSAQDVLTPDHAVYHIAVWALALLVSAIGALLIYLWKNHLSHVKDDVRSLKAAIAGARDDCLGEIAEVRVEVRELKVTQSNTARELYHRIGKVETDLAVVMDRCKRMTHDRPDIGA